MKQQGRACRVILVGMLILAIFLNVDHAQAKASNPTQLDSFKIAIKWLSTFAMPLNNYQDQIAAHLWSDDFEEELKFVKSLEDSLNKEYQRLKNDEKRQYVLIRYKDSAQRARLQDEERNIVNQLNSIRSIINSNKSVLFHRKQDDSLKSLSSLSLSVNRKIAVLEKYLTPGLALIIFTVVLLGVWVFVVHHQLGKRRADEVKKMFEQLSEKNTPLNAAAVHDENTNLPLFEEIKAINNKLQTIQEKLNAQIGSSDSKSGQETPTQALIKAYNGAVLDDARYNGFLERYGKQLMIIGITNSEQRIDNEKIRPVFAELSNGELCVIPLEEDQRTKYVAIPKYGLLYAEKKFRRGSLGHVFECKESGSEGQKILVQKPATFQPETQGGSWRLIEKGEISLA